MRIDITIGIDKQQAFRQYIQSGQARRDSYEQDKDKNFIQYVNADRIIDAVEYQLGVRAGNAILETIVYVEKYKPKKRFLTVKASY